MKDEGIILSEKHGLNPSLEICSICGKDISVVIFGKLKDDVEAPKQVCLGHLCEECKKDLEKRKEVIFLEIDNNMYTGNGFSIPEGHVNPDVLNNLKGERLVYVSKKTFEEIKRQIDNTNELN